MQPQLANTIKEIVESNNTSIEFLKHIFKDDNDLNGVNESAFIFEAKENFLKSESFYLKMHLLEQELELSFNPSEINNKENNQIEIEELYYLLIENKALRLNAKLTANEATGITVEAGYRRLKVGSKVDITYLSQTDYVVFSQKISIHTVNLLSNAKVKEIKEKDDGSAALLYDDTDNQPMYISYTGFKTIDEAKQKKKTIMDEKEMYTNALTIYELMMEAYKSDKGSPILKIDEDLDE